MLLQLLALAFAEPTLQDLPNGLHVEMEEVEGARNVSLRLVIADAGSSEGRNPEGLAHLTEHAVFFGSEAYPEKDGLNAFATDHDGSRNGGTSSDQVSYTIDVESEAWREAAERLADMLTAPLLAPEHLAASREAVEAEYRMKRLYRSRRLDQLHRKLMNPEHPRTVLGVGNNETLTGTPEELADAARALVDKAYAPHKMTLSIRGSIPVAQQLAVAEAVFARLPSRPGGTPSMLPLYRPEDLGKWVTAQLPGPPSLIVRLPHASDVAEDKSAYCLTRALENVDKDSSVDRLRAVSVASSIQVKVEQHGEEATSYDLHVALLDPSVDAVERALAEVWNGIHSAREPDAIERCYQELQVSSSEVTTHSLSELAPEQSLVLHLREQPVENGLHERHYGFDYAISALSPERATSLAAPPSEPRPPPPPTPFRVDWSEQVDSRRTWEKVTNPTPTTRVVSVSVARHNDKRVKARLELQLPDTHPAEWEVVARAWRHRLAPTARALAAADQGLFVHRTRSGLALVLDAHADIAETQLSRTFSALRNLRATSDDLLLWKRQIRSDLQHPTASASSRVHEQFARGWEARPSAEEQLAALDAIHEARFHALVEELTTGAQVRLSWVGARAPEGDLEKIRKKLPEGGKSVELGVRPPSGSETFQASFPAEDSAVSVLFVGDSQDEAAFRLLAELLQAPMRRALRTEAQLGYLASSYYVSLSGTPGLQLTVQSANRSPEDLLTHLDAALAGFVADKELWKADRIDTAIERTSADYKGISGLTEGSVHAERLLLGHDVDWYTKLSKSLASSSGSKLRKTLSGLIDGGDRYVAMVPSATPAMD